MQAAAASKKMTMQHTPNQLSMHGAALASNLTLAQYMHAGSSGEEEGDEDFDPYQLPITHEAALSAHGKAVVALDVDHSGSRLVTGSMDYGVHIYDFNGMKADLRHFKSLEPQEGHPVHALSWSPSG